MRRRPQRAWIVQHYINTKQFNGSVLVARNGSILFDKGYGDANLSGRYGACD